MNKKNNQEISKNNNLIYKPINIKTFSDKRGTLKAFNFSELLNFEPKRIYYILDVPEKEIRGNHAHKECEQIFICQKGFCNLTIDNGFKTKTFVMDQQSDAIYIPNKIWTSLSNFSSNAVLMILASDEYDEYDYINDYENFLTIIKN